MLNLICETRHSKTYRDRELRKDVLKGFAALLALLLFCSLCNIIK